MVTAIVGPDLAIPLNLNLESVTMETKFTDSNDSLSNKPISPSDAERLGSLIMGGALVLTGLSQRSLRSALLAMAGGGLAYNGALGEKKLEDIVIDATGLNQEVRVEKTVTIQNRSPEELYQFWRNFENLPIFMKYLKSVNMINERRSRWIAEAPFGNRITWDAEIITDQANQLIAWTSIEGADLDNSGFVRFKPVPGDRGTEVKVVLAYKAPGGALTVALAKIFGEEPEQQVSDDLRRFQMLMETGEIATIEGQSTGRQS
jgi:uncharacterized membrane protein